MSGSDARIEEIRDWLAGIAGWRHDCRLEPASADASFRRYFRVWRTDGVARVVMDAPPDKEDTAPYLKVSRLLGDCGVHVPDIEEAEPNRGLLLLEDLGRTPMLSRLNAGGDAAALYGEALDALGRIQVRGAAGAAQLPRYDRAVLEREMQLLPEWYCARHLRLEASCEDRVMLAQSFDFLIREALAQPVVLVHRDYHSRNLMITDVRSPGVIDFQDALAGPVGYDLVSLLKDCYIAWPRARVEQWVAGYRQRLVAVGAVGAVGATGATGATGTAGAAGAAGASSALAAEDGAQFLRWFDMIGLQRHLKVLGIFARLWYRDGKSGYLADLPLTLEYVLDTSARYPELRSFNEWAQRRLAAGLSAANARELSAALPGGNPH